MTPRDGNRLGAAALALAATLCGIGVPDAHAQRVVAALGLGNAPTLMNASGRHVVTYTFDRITADDTDSVADVYVFTVATGAFRRLSRAGLIGLWDEVDTATIELLSLSDDGRYLAYTVQRRPPSRPAPPKVLSRYDIQTATRIVVRDAAFDPFRLPTMSRDGSTLAWLGANNAVLVGTAGETAVAIGQACRPQSQCENGPILTARGERVLYAPEGGGFGAPVDGLVVFDRVSVRSTPHPEFRPGSPVRMTTTASGSHVLATDYTGQTAVFDLARRVLDPVPVTSASTAAISDDARYVLSGEGNIYDRQLGTPLASGGQFSHAMSADGRIVAVTMFNLYTLLDLDGDADGMPDPWENIYHLDTTSSADADRDDDGDGLTNREEYARGSHPRGTYRRYFAEGVSSSFFETSVHVYGFQPITSLFPRPITITFLGNDGRAVSRTLRWQPNEFAPFGAVTPPLALVSNEYAVVVESEDPFAAERITTWGAPRPVGAHASSGVAAPEFFWSFAEGSTRNGFQLFYLLSNPGTVDAHVVAGYMCAGGAQAASEHVVAAGRRVTVWVNQLPAPLNASECGAHFQSDQPIVAERSMYLTADGGFTAGTSAAGQPPTLPPVTWSFAAGATADPFEMFLTLANPLPASSCDAEVTYMLSDGTRLQRIHHVPVGERLTVWVDQEDPRLAQAAAVAAHVACPTGPIFAERAMWWRGERTAAFVEGHVEHGARVPATVWGMAHVPESATISLLNESDATGRVRITMYARTGAPAAQRVIDVPPGRTDIVPSRTWPGLPPGEYGAKVESLAVGSVAPVQLVVERTHYIPGTPAGSTFLATPLP